MRKDAAAYETMYDLMQPVVKDHVVLELATGTGLIAKHLLNSARMIEATDASPEMIAQAKKDCLSTKVHFSVQDMFHLPYSDEAFDIVIVSNALHIVPQPELALDFIIARPRMALYMQVSTQIYRIYLKYIAPEDIHVYSIDEVFIDVTPYRSLYGRDAQALARTMILDVLHTTGITATAGIGTNLYLAKIAMDIGAKHAPPDENGVRIAALDERSYRQTLWSHRPLTDFWRVGRGYARKLEAKGLYTMGDIARCSLGGPDEFYNEDLLYRMFGVQAELLIDHAWGWEPCTIADIKAYRPQSHSLSSGQVLQEPYVFDKARLVLLEMADALALDLVGKGLVTDQLVLSVGYDRESLTRPELRGAYHGPVTTDPYGRPVPKAAHGSLRLSLCEENTMEEVEYMLREIPPIVEYLRSMSPVWKALERGEQQHLL